MLHIKRIGAARPGQGLYALEIEMAGGRRLQIPHAHRTRLNTPAKMLTEITAALGPVAGLAIELPSPDAAPRVTIGGARSG